jgi:GTP-binding protein
MKVEFLAHSKTAEAFPKPSFSEVAFVGRSNTGKSSLINTLVGQKIARTSSTPGRTQGLCFFQVKGNLIFVDFPGFGYAKISKKEREDWGVLAEAYYDRRRTLKGTVWVYDLRRDPDSLDFQMRDWLESKGKPYLLALTKCDRLGRGEWERRRRALSEGLELDPERFLLFSSKTREGLKKLWHWIENGV